MALSALPFQALLPAMGALALIGTGIRRSRARRAEGPRAPRAPIQMPKEMPAPPARRRAAKPDAADLPTVACSGCGTPIPQGETQCRWCELKAGKPSQSNRQTLINWALFLAGAAAILAVGFWLQ